MHKQNKAEDSGEVKTEEATLVHKQHFKIYHRAAIPLLEQTTRDLYNFSSGWMLGKIEMLKGEDNSS